jgi:hypothetical protein
MDEEEQPCKKLKTLPRLLGHDDLILMRRRKVIPCLNTNTTSRGKCKNEWKMLGRRHLLCLKEV